MGASSKFAAMTAMGSCMIFPENQVEPVLPLQHILKQNAVSLSLYAFSQPVYATDPK